MSLSPSRGLALAALVTLLACGGGGSSPAPVPPQSPAISSINPSHGSPGTTVVITGTGLSATTAVAFGGGGAFSFVVVGDTEIDAVVPANAASGAIQVTKPSGSATSLPFTVDPFQTPTITGFTPSAIDYGGTLVNLSGTHLIGATQVQFNGANAVSFGVSSDTQILATSPTPLAAGTISVTTPGGKAVSAPFQVAWGAPSLTSVRPARGPVGTPVVLRGSNLGYPNTTITLNGTPAAITSQSASQLAFTVPAGATSGSLVVSTPGGAISQTFPVDVGVALDLHVDKVQFTQSTQTLDNTVPIVAGKAGLVRVFALANLANSAAPTVEVTLFNNGAPVFGYPKTVPAPAGSVPTTLNEGVLTSSWNLAIPGTDLTTPTGSGYSVMAVVDPTGNVAESDKTDNALTVPLTATTVPIFKTTIFPVVLASGTGNITAANKDAWVARLARMYPVASTDVVVGSTFTGSVSSLVSNDSDKHWETLLLDLATKHSADGATDRYYFGALKVSYTSGVAGLGYVPSSASSPFYSRTAIGWDKTGYQDGGNYPEVFAHETGHNMGRGHSPCAPSGQPLPSGLDLSYPYAGASIGVWGYDSTANQLKDPTTCKDIMAYCSPVWVSDYVYKGILNFRAASGGFLVVGALEEAPSLAASATVDCLIVRGILHGDGKVDLRPAFRTQAHPSALSGQSEYVLECLDAKGQPIFSTTLELMDLGCSANAPTRHFVMALPLAANLLDGITGLRVLKAGQVMASLQPTGSAPLKRRVTTAPEAHRLDPSQVELQWDATAHPAALVRDGETGEVIAILGGGRQTFATPARQIDLVLSDGVVGQAHRLAITE